MLIYNFNCTTKSYTLCNLIFQPIKLQVLCDNLIVWKDSYYKQNNKEPAGLISTVRIKQNISKSLLFVGKSVNEVWLN